MSSCICAGTLIANEHHRVLLRRKRVSAFAGAFLAIVIVIVLFPDHHTRCRLHLVAFEVETRLVAHKGPLLSYVSSLDDRERPSRQADMIVGLISETASVKQPMSRSTIFARVALFGLWADVSVKCQQCVSRQPSLGIVFDTPVDMSEKAVETVHEYIEKMYKWIARPWAKVSIALGAKSKHYCCPKRASPHQRQNGKYTRAGTVPLCLSLPHCAS